MLSWDKIPEAFDWNGCLKDLIALCITAVLLLLGVFVSELKHKFAFLMKKNKRKKLLQKYNEMDANEEIFSLESEQNKLNENFLTESDESRLRKSSNEINMIFKNKEIDENVRIEEERV